MYFYLIRLHANIYFTYLAVKECAVRVEAFVRVRSEPRRPPQVPRGYILCSVSEEVMLSRSIFKEEKLSIND